MYLANESTKKTCIPSFAEYTLGGYCPYEV